MMRAYGLLIGLMLALAACVQVQSQTAQDQISFGDGGSIFGGASWTIRADDTATFSARGDSLPPKRRGWVMTSKDAGSVSYSVPGIYNSVLMLVTAGLKDGTLARPPAFDLDCTDAGGLFLLVQPLDNEPFRATSSHCTPKVNGISPRVQAYHTALRDLISQLSTNVRVATGAP